MLIDFISTNRDDLIARAQAMVVKRSDPPPTDAASTTGIPMFLDQLVATLEQETSVTSERMNRTATAHGAALLASGYSIAQVVHNYGDLCQAITELAYAVDAPIAADDFHVLNLCLDNAIAEAITEYTRLRDQSMAASETARTGVFAHELRNKLSAAVLGFDAIRSGRAPIQGNVASIVARSLHGISDLVDRTLLEVRVDSGILRRCRSRLDAIIATAHDDVTLEAKRRGVMLNVSAVDAELEVDVDVQILGGVLTNLLQNALKFTPKGGLVRLGAMVVGTHVEIEVEDECGGLPPGRAEDLFAAFEQRGTDRSGVGLGLFICRKGVEANGGTIGARDVPGVGCLFCVDLPLAEAVSQPFVEARSA